MRPTESSGHKLTAVRTGHQPEVNIVPWPEVPKSAYLPSDEFKRPRAHYPSEVENSDRLHLKTSESGFRPPSRHKPTPKAVGLELPPRPVTPPDSGFDSFFDRTWSFTLKHGEEEAEDGKEKGATHIPSNNGRPKSQKKLLGTLEQSNTLLAWEDRPKPRTSCDKASKPASELEKHSKGEIPVTVTKTGMPIEGSECIFIRRRLQTADNGGGKGWTPKIAAGKSSASGRIREETHIRGSVGEIDHFSYAD